MAKKNKNVDSLLASVVDATKSATGHAFISEAKLKELVDAGYVGSEKLEFDASLKNEAGDVAIRASDAYLQSLNGSTATESTPVMNFEIVSGLVPPTAVRSAMKEEIYPFSKLEIGDTFFIPKTDKVPDPAKSFASTVSSATRRYSEPSTVETKKNRAGQDVPVLVPTRRFTIRPVTKGQTWPNGYVESADGARVFRIAL